MIFSGHGPGTPYEELKEASALAVDMGEIEDNGQEQIGDLHGLLMTLYGVNRQVNDCLRFRVLRKVVGESSPWGKKDSVVDTTGYDNQFVAFRTYPSMKDRNDNDWFYGEGVSPAVLVMDNNYQDGESGTVILPPEGSEFAVIPKLKEGINDKAVWVLMKEGLFLMQPSLALPQIGMTPEQVWSFMDQERVLSSFGEKVFSRSE